MPFRPIVGTMSLHDVLGFMTFGMVGAAAAAPGMKVRPGAWYAVLGKLGVLRSGNVRMAAPAACVAGG